MIAIGYVRCSTQDQSDSGLGLEAQEAKIKAWCDVNDYVLFALFVDAGLSGKRADNRPGLSSALEAVCKEKGSALVVYSLSRLARSTKDAITIAERLNKVGADLVSLSEKIDTTSAAGKMVFRMLAVLAEFERDLVSERTTAALAVKKANGQRVGSIPYGFDLAEDGVTLARNESEQGVIVMIRDMHSRRFSLQRIARELTYRGIPTKTRKSQKWTHQAVNRILQREHAA